MTAVGWRMAVHCNWLQRFAVEHRLLLNWNVEGQCRWREAAWSYVLVRGWCRENDDSIETCLQQQSTGETDQKHADENAQTCTEFISTRACAYARPQTSHAPFFAYVRVRSDNVCGLKSNAERSRRTSSRERSILD